MNQFNLPGRLFVVGAILTWSANSAVADFVAITAPTNTTMQFVSAGTIGAEFLTGNLPLTVSALGVWDESTGTPNLAESHQVGIWSISGGTPLAQVTIPPGSPSMQLGAYDYVNLSTPLLLSANTDYVIGVSVGSVDTFHNSLVIAQSAQWPVFDSPRLTAVERRGVFGGGFAFPATSLSGTGDSPWDAANFLFTVPEPPTYVLLVLGVVAVFSMQLRRKVSFRSAPTV